MGREKDYVGQRSIAFDRPFLRSVLRSGSLRKGLLARRAVRWHTLPVLQSATPRTPKQTCRFFVNDGPNSGP